jgi:signal transduction histidine kinase
MGKPIDHYETKRLKKNGDIIDVSLTVSPIQDAQGIITEASKILRDISKEKTAEQKLELQNKELVKANAELDRFVYSISHDLRAPLKSLLGLIGIMKRSTDPGDKVQQTSLDLMKSSVVKLDNFIEDILGYSKNTRMEIANETIVFEDFIREIKDSHKFVDESGEVNFQVAVQQETPFISDKRRINVVLNNLISNAIKYSDQLKGKESFVKIQVQCSQQHAVIIVEDNGIGISAASQEKVFDMFYRATTLSSGSGLGMYIVKETLDKLNGKIKMQSELGKGTTFTVEIPNQVTL